MIAVNCRAGKGRTGTIICCYFIFCGRFNNPNDALDYYSKKRFNIGEGVTQPSQKRYVYYFYSMLNEKFYFPLVRNLRGISINNIPMKSANTTIKPYFEIYLGNQDKVFYSNKLNYFEQKKIFSNNTNLISITDSNFDLTVSGDITVKIYNNGMLSNKKMGRISFNTAFLGDQQTTQIFRIHEIDPDNLAKNKKIPKSFEIHIKLSKLCDCQNRTQPIQLCANCTNLLEDEVDNWKEINNIIEVRLY